MIARLPRTTGTRLVAILAVPIVTVVLAGCGASGEGVVASTAAARTLHYSPAGTGPVVAAVDRAVIVERRATVIEVDAIEGQLVKAGQMLLRVYTIGQSTAVAQADDQLRADEKQLPFVQATSGKVGAATLALLNKIDQDRVNLTRLKNAPTVITAPVAGRVSGLDTLPGSTLDRSDAVLHVVDDTTVKVVVPMVVGYRNQLAVGQQALISMPSLPGKTFTAAISGIGAVVPAQADGKTISAEETVPVTVSLPNGAGSVTTGSNAYVRFPLVRSAAVTVNALAVLGQDRPYVFVIADKVVRQRQVVVGASDGRWTEITSGLSVGDDVVISGGAKLTDGTSVRVTQSDDS